MKGVLCSSNTAKPNSFVVSQRPILALWPFTIPSANQNEYVMVVYCRAKWANLICLSTVHDGQIAAVLFVLNVRFQHLI